MKTHEVLSTLYKRLAFHNGCSRFNAVDNVCLREAEPFLTDNSNQEKPKKLLKELYILVKGECPSLLNEDSGGDSKLAIEIEEILK